jgi:hypothetical protein
MPLHFLENLVGEGFGFRAHSAAGLHSAGRGLPALVQAGEEAVRPVPPFHKAPGRAAVEALNGQQVIDDGERVLVHENQETGGGEVAPGKKRIENDERGDREQGYGELGEHTAPGDEDVVPLELALLVLARAAGELHVHGIDPIAAEPDEAGVAELVDDDNEEHGAEGNEHPHGRKQVEEGEDEVEQGRGVEFDRDAEEAELEKRFVFSIHNLKSVTQKYITAIGCRQER